MKKKGSGGGGCGCLGAPLRALSRACDSACDLYVRGMSRCARGLPSGSSSAAGGFVGRGGGFDGSPLSFRVSPDKADDLVRAASSASASSRRQRRVAAEPQPEPELAIADQAVGYGGAGKMGRGLVGSAGKGIRPTARKRAVAAATMGTIAEDAPCDFGPDYGASLLLLLSHR